MKRNAIVVLAVFVALGIGFLMRRTPEVASAALPASTPQETMASQPEPKLRAQVDAVAAQPERELAPAVLPATSSDTTGPRISDTCIVIGRVLDQNDAPLEKAIVRLFAYRVWTEGVDVPRLEGPSDYRGFEVATDARGVFRIEAPVPTAEHPWLTIAPDPFHDSHRVIFGTGERDDAPPLKAGTRDLGDIRVATTGAVRGRVTDDSGAPLEGVEMGLGTQPSYTLQRDTKSLADGSYFIPHAPVGTYGVKAKAEGYLSQFHGGVRIDAAQETSAIDFVLVAAPSIQGRVVDEVGRPLAGARLWGWPTTSGSGAGAKSAADGSFVIYLPQVEPYSLGAKLQGYASWGSEHDKTILYEPGTKDLEIVMRSLPLTQFLVVDDATSQPIERFGLSILEENGSGSSHHVFTERRAPQQALHPGGAMALTARERIDLYVVVSDGYELTSGDVEFEAPDSPRQTLRLKRNQQSTDSASAAKTSLPDASINGRVLVPTGVSAGGLTVILDNRKGRGLKTVTTTDGAFHFASIPAGAHTLTLDDRPGELAESAAVKVELLSGQTLEVTLDARDRGTCDVELVIDFGGASAENLQVDLVSCATPEERTTLGKCDAEGRITGAPRAWGEARVVVWLPSMRRIEHPTIRLTLVRGAHVAQTVRYAFGAVSIALPSGTTVPRDGRILLHVSPTDGGTAFDSAPINFRNGEPDNSARAEARMEGGRAWFGLLPAGELDVTLQFVDSSEKPALEPLGDGRFQVRTRAYYEATRRVTLIAGEALDLRFD